MSAEKTQYFFDEEGTLRSTREMNPGNQPVFGSVESAIPFGFHLSTENRLAWGTGIDDRDQITAAKQRFEQ